MIIRSGKPFSFNYPTTDRATGLYVAANIYEVTSGTPAFLSLVAMSEIASGIYAGNYSPTAGKSYLAVILAYTDNTYTTIDTDRPPVVENYDYCDVNDAILNFNFGAYDHAGTLTVNAAVYDISSGTPAPLTTVSMVHVLSGVYYGRYVGAINKSYLVLKVPTDTTYAPGSEDFDTFILDGSDRWEAVTADQLALGVTKLQDGVDVVGILDVVTNLFSSANLIGQDNSAILREVI